jgi:quercetin dioxygenase-like cupin family protein
MRLATTVFAMLAFVPAVAFATPPAGVVSNVIIGQGATLGPIKEHAAVGDTWAVNLEDKGQSEFYFQDLVVGPSGYTGWHSHPGLLLITVKEGTVEFYDDKCTKRTYATGQSFIEGADPHTAVNPGTGNTRLLIAYVVKKGDPRRIEAAQPPCGATLNLR